MSDPHSPSHEDFVSIAILQIEVTQLTKDVKELTDCTKELVEAWKAAGKMVIFIKYLAGISTSIGVLWIVIAHLFGKR